MHFSTRELAAADGLRFDRSKCAKGERRFHLGRAATRSTLRPKFATECRAVA